MYTFVHNSQHISITRPKEEAQLSQKNARRSVSYLKCLYVFNFFCNKDVTIYNHFNIRLT